MALEGFKYWADGEPVVGIDANAFLMSQSVMRFDNASDRDSALARTLTNGMMAYNKSTTTLQLYDGSSWLDVATGTLTADHGALTGLADDDHTQYHNDARGDARYYTQSQIDSSLSGYLPLSGGTLTGALTLGGDLNYANNAIIASNGGSTNIDHIWHDDGGNTWHFCSDTSYKATGNSALQSGSLTTGSISSGAITSGAITASGEIRANSNISLRSGNAVRDSIYRVGGVFFTWDSDSYGTNTHHSIRSTNGDSWTDAITINSFGNVRINIDSNSNGSNSFTIGHHTTDTANTILTINDNYNGIYLTGWYRTYGQRGWYSESYGGGIYMIDTTWVRTYNNKRLYTGSGQIRSDAGNGFNGPNLTTTYSYNTLRWNSSNGDFMPYASLTEMKTDITDIGGLLSYLNERSLIYYLKPKIFTEANDRVDANGNPIYTTRGEYAHGMLAEEVLEVAPELAYYDHNGELLSYGNDALIPDIIAELQRLMPMVEELYSTAHPDWVPPLPRPPERAQEERDRYETARQQQAITGIENPADPLNGKRHLGEEEN